MSSKIKKAALISGGIGIGICLMVGSLYLMRNKIIEMKYQGDTYYTKVIEEGVFDDDVKQYRYVLEGTSEDKGNILLDFYGMDEKPIKKGAYLEVTYRSPEGVLRWRGVDKTNVPEKVFNILEH